MKSFTADEKCLHRTGRAEQSNEPRDRFDGRISLSWAITLPRPLSSPLSLLWVWNWQMGGWGRGDPSLTTNNKYLSYLPALKAHITFSPPSSSSSSSSPTTSIATVRVFFTCEEPIVANCNITLSPGAFTPTSHHRWLVPLDPSIRTHAMAIIFLSNIH